MIGRQPHHQLNTNEHCGDAISTTTLSPQDRPHHQHPHHHSPAHLRQSCIIFEEEVEPLPGHIHIQVGA
jgi:hypothetical protein